MFIGEEGASCHKIDPYCLNSMNVWGILKLGALQLGQILV